MGSEDVRMGPSGFGLVSLLATGSEMETPAETWLDSQPALLAQLIAAIIAQTAQFQQVTSRISCMEDRLEQLDRGGTPTPQRLPASLGKGSVCSVGDSDANTVGKASAVSLSPAVSVSGAASSNKMQKEGVEA